MIEKIHIQNFKSIYDLELNVSRVNLFIGENGSGKRNLLEALVFVFAAESDKLDNEFLVSRGLRVSEPVLMRSAFNKDDKNKKVIIHLTQDKTLHLYELNNENTEYSKWVHNSEIEYFRYMQKNMPHLSKEDIKKISLYLEKANPKFYDEMINELNEKNKLNEKYDDITIDIEIKKKLYKKIIL